MIDPQQALGVGQQALSVGGRGTAALMSYQQRCTEYRFQFFDVLRNRPLGDVTFGSGGTEVTAAYQREKGGDVLQIEVCQARFSITGVLIAP